MIMMRTRTFSEYSMNDNPHRIFAVCFSIIMVRIISKYQTAFLSSRCFSFVFMPVYLVYAARYKTRAGTPRVYVGQSCAYDIRKQFHKKERRPTPLRASDAKDIDYKELQENLPNLETALAVEALFAARFVTAEPKT